MALAKAEPCRYERTPGKPAKLVLGGGLEPPCLAAYAPQTYVSAISPPERTFANLVRNAGKQESERQRKEMAIAPCQNQVVSVFATSDAFRHPPPRRWYRENGK